MHERIKMVREYLDLSQSEFGGRIGINQSTIACYESGIRTPTDVVIKAICMKFDVKEDWLRNGNGSMFGGKNDAIRDLKDKYSLDDDSYFFIKRFVELSDSERKIVMKFFNVE